MALRWERHRCTYYCVDGIHAVPVLATPSYAPHSIVDEMQQHAEAGERILSIQAATEADIRIWHEEMMRDLATRNIRTPFRDDLVPYLMRIWRPSPESVHTTTKEPLYP